MNWCWHLETMCTFSFFSQMPCLWRQSSWWRKLTNSKETSKFQYRVPIKMECLKWNQYLWFSFSLLDWRYSSSWSGWWFIGLTPFFTLLTTYFLTKVTFKQPSMKMFKKSTCSESLDDKPHNHLDMIRNKRQLKMQR